MNMHNLTVRVLSKHKPTLKRQILKEENIMKSMIGHSLSTYKIKDKTKVYIYGYNRYRKLKFMQVKISVHEIGPNRR
jgi:hypothetical protein